MDIRRSAWRLLAIFAPVPISFFKHIVHQDHHIIQYAPTDQLKGIVEGLYVYKTPRDGSRQLFFNDGFPVVAFMPGSDDTMTVRSGGSERQVGCMWVCGGLLKNVYCQPSRPATDIFVIRFYPIPFHQLFDRTGECFEQQAIFDFADIAGDDYCPFKEAWYCASCAEERVGIITAFLTQKITDYSCPGILLDIMEYAEKQRVTTITGLLENYSVRLNYKWLERNFRKYLGISPKNYLLIRRFINAYIELDMSASKNLLQVALSNGYCDDNHLIKDFRKFTGTSPARYFSLPI